MASSIQRSAETLCAQYHNDRTRLMDIVRTLHAEHGYMDDDAIETVASRLGAHRVEIESMLTFYSFFSRKKRGKIVIRLCNDIIDRMNGTEMVADAFRQQLGIDFGETTPDGRISLEYTPCIGMSDQAPAALVNDEVVTYLSTDRVREIVAVLRQTDNPHKLVHRLGDGKNAHDLIRSMVHNNVRRPGEVIFDRYEANNTGLSKALSMSPVEVINEVKNARLRGRGGAGFPTGMKWEFTRGAEGEVKYVICNSDEGEPGTFKDRVLLTEYPDRIFEGMTIAGYAIGAEVGILYLRGEYAYLYRYLATVLEERRKNGLLGKNIMKSDYSFDVRIELGAGAYVCGEETALISSLEGTAGLPKTKPPFPAQQGFLNQPTVVNNVETLCVVPDILDRGAGWFAGIGTKSSSGTKLLSVAGDCARPGIYEYPFGVTMSQILADCGAEDCYAVQVGGASGQMINESDFRRTISYEDLATGGSIMIFDRTRDVLDAVKSFMEFFVDENCGYCTPCRVGNRLMLTIIDRILKGDGAPEDIATLKRLGNSVKTASRCGLGQTSPNPILSSIEKFGPDYERRFRKKEGVLRPSFNIESALAESSRISGRRSAVLS
ncbi:NAD(P)H-dependent oxidoreductase subunit E [Salinispira pacifica]